MTNQELFDKVVRAIVKQGRGSINSEGLCVYRGPDGLKCAVGHIIPDELYSPLIEKTSAMTLVTGKYKERHLFEESFREIENPFQRRATIEAHERVHSWLRDVVGVDADLLEHLQAAHDDAAIEDHDDGCGEPVEVATTGEVFISRFMQSARLIARRHGLVMPDLT